PGRDLRTAVRAKAARIVTDQAEGWRAVDTLVRDLDGVGERIEALEIAHDAIQRVLRGCAAVLSRYEAVRTAAVARSGADDERYQEAVSSAIRTTDTLRSDLGDARAALKK